MTCKTLPNIKPGVGPFVSGLYFTSFFRKAGAVFFFAVLACGFLVSGSKGLAVAEDKTAVDPARPDKPQMVSFEEYAKMTQDERWKIITDTSADLLRTLLMKGKEARAQCLEHNFANDKNPDPLFKLLAELEAKAELEEETPGTKYEMSVPWHIARRILATCPDQVTSVAK